MRITDYEKGHTLRDISISLTLEEAQDLALFLNRLLKSPGVNRMYLSEVVGAHLEKEITISVETKSDVRAYAEVA
jgi:hypothetical protein